MTARRVRLTRSQIVSILVIAVVATAVGIAARANGDKGSSGGAGATASHGSGTDASTVDSHAPPSSRRLVVSFVSAFKGPDSMIVRYFSHRGDHKLVYVCNHVTHQYKTYITGFSNTWSSVGDCSAGGGHSNRLTAKFDTPHIGKDNLYLRIWFSPTRSYRFTCINPGALTKETDTASWETREASVCSVDKQAPSTIQCGQKQAPPSAYQHIVVIMFENRTWSQVGGVGFGDMPYAAQLAKQCTYYADFHETNANQKSLPQYIGLTSGVDNPHVYNDCAPSETCRSYDDNIFRQVRESGGTARTYVEGATGRCDGSIHRANVPALYYFGGNDHSYCTDEVRPLPEINYQKLPTFAMIIPTRCNNGHGCGNDVVDGWLRVQLQNILTGTTYGQGRTAVFVLWDEDRPMPNLIIAPTAHKGEIKDVVATQFDTLHTFEELLGLPILPSVRNAKSLRPSAHI